MKVDMKVEAVAHGTGVIVDSSVTGKGSAFAIDINAKASAILTGNGDTNDKSNVKITCDCKNPDEKQLAEETAKLVFKRIEKSFGHSYGAKIEIETQIPSGLGKNEAIFNAVSLAITGAVAKKHGSINRLLIDKYLNEQFIVINDKIIDRLWLVCAGTDLGLRFDRVVASMYGGFVVCGYGGHDNYDNEDTDKDTNEKNRSRILRRGELENLDAVILVPKTKTELKNELELMKLFRNEIDIIWNEALKGNLYCAMKLNCLLHENRIAKRVLGAGALTASISDGVTIGLLRTDGRADDSDEKIDEKNLNKVVNSISDYGDVLVHKVANDKSGILGKPRKIIKIKEFLEMKGDEEFHYL